MDFFDAIRQSDAFKKLAVDDLLFVEYTCEGGGPPINIWSRSNYFTYVVSGEMILSGIDQDYVIRAGECYFVRPGGYSIPTFVEDFCDLILFIPDDFIRHVVSKHFPQLSPPQVSDRGFSAVMPIHLDNSLKGFYQSLAGYFSTPIDVLPNLIRLKCEEFLINILSSRENWQVVQYVSQIYHQPVRNIKEIMQANFTHPLSMTEFAMMSHRSLSTFRRDFQAVFKQPPGRWLRERRLEFAATLLRTSHLPVKEIVGKTGFKNRSHFMRTFKEEFGLSPINYRSKFT